MLPVIKGGKARESTFLEEASGDEPLDGVASEMTKMGSLIGHRIDCNGACAAGLSASFCSSTFTF